MNAPEHSQAKTEAGPFAPSERALSGLGKKRLSWAPRLILFAVFVALLTSVFCRQLVLLFIHAANTELHSYILFVPFVSAYLLYLKRHDLPRDYCSSPVWAVISLLCALGALAAKWSARGSPLSLSHNDDLALLSFSFVCFLAVGGFLFLGRRWMAAASFPFAFLFFLVPLPDRVVDWLEKVLMLASADAANLFFNIAGTPLLRDGTVFELPGFSIQVAQECSGIRSTWVLFITSSLAAYLFLKAPWRRIVLIAAAIPLGILRNGFRIFVIGLVCVQVGPQMINSALHRHGGPLFFALSLAPLSLLLWWLRRRETRVGSTNRK